MSLQIDKEAFDKLLQIDRIEARQRINNCMLRNIISVSVGLLLMINGLVLVFCSNLIFFRVSTTVGIVTILTGVFMMFIGIFIQDRDYHYIMKDYFKIVPKRQK